MKKATDKFNPNDPDAIANAGDWHLKKRALAKRASQQYEALFHNPGQLCSSLEQRARQAAKKLGLIAHKSRSKHLGNLGEFQLIDPKLDNRVLAGHHFDLTPQDVIAFCHNYKPNP